MATTWRIVYHWDDETIKKDKREFSLTDEIMELINSWWGWGWDAINWVKVNWQIVNPDQAWYVWLTIPWVINNLTSNSTTDALSAKQWKVLYEYIQALQHVWHFLALWNTATWLPVTNPETSPYTYNTWDYYIVSNVAAEGWTNYKPNGSSYTINVASTTVESWEVQVNDLYFYDWYERRLLDNSWWGGGIAVDSSLSTTSTNPVQNMVITNRLNQMALDANTKTFFLANGNDLTTAQAAYDWIRQWKMALVTLNWETYIYKTTASNKATFEDVGWYTTIDNNWTTWVYLKTLELSLNWTTVEQISLSTKSQSSIIPSYLATDKNYSTAYVPQYDGSPATKKYVDDKFAWVPTYTAWTGIDITNNVISNTQTSAEWWNITGNIQSQTDLQNALDWKQDELTAWTWIDITSNTISNTWVTSVNWNTGAVTVDTWYVLLTYGQSTWNDVVAAIESNKLVFIRTSTSDTTPWSWDLTRRVVLTLYSPNNSAEFQYYRWHLTQRDTCWVYKINRTTGWELSKRNAQTVITAGTGISVSSDLKDPVITNTWVTSFNWNTWAVTYTAPVSSVNGQTWAVTVNDIKTGTAAPSNPTEWMLWYDTTNDVLKSYDWTNWNEVGGNTDTSNVKAFFLEDDEDTTGATEVLERVAEWYSEEGYRYPIIYMGGDTYLISAGAGGGFRWTSTMTLRFVNVEPERDVIGYSRTELSQDATEISWTLDTDTFAVSNVTIQTETNILWDFLEAKAWWTYITPRTPAYDWDPTTKKYVDDKVSWAISRWTTAPSSPVEWQLWYDTTNDALKVYNWTAWVAVWWGWVNITDVTVTTAYGTAAKVWTTTAWNYTPTAWDFIMVNFVNWCSVANPTLNIDGSWAKNIRTGNSNATTSTLALWTTSNSNIKMLMYYDGTYYRTWSTSNNTYSGMSQSTASAGTSTTSSLISAKVLSDTIKEKAITLDPNSPLDVTTIRCWTETQYQALATKWDTTAYLCVED